MQRPLPSLDRETLRLVVGFDFSAGGRRALRHALSVAQRHGQCEVHVVYVSDPTELEKAQWLNLPSQLWKRVNAVADELAVAREVRVVTHVRRGDVDVCLRRLAAQFQADCIILGGPSAGALEGQRQLSATGETGVWLVHREEVEPWTAEATQPRRPAIRQREAEALYTGARRVGDGLSEPRRPAGGGFEPSC